MKRQMMAVGLVAIVGLSAHAQPWVKASEQRWENPANVPTGARVDESNLQVIAVRPGDDTLLQAADKAIQLLKQGKGVKLALGPGTYYVSKTVDLMELGASANDAVLVIEGSSPGEVILSGARSFPPAGWELVDAEKGLYRHDWKMNLGYHSQKAYPTGATIAQRRDVLVLNGEPLRQEILEETKSELDKKGAYNTDTTIHFAKYNDPRSTLGPGSFGVAEINAGDKIQRLEGNFDKAPHADPDTIWLRLPEGMTAEQFAQAEVRVGTTDTILRIVKNNVVLRNLTFRHATSYWGPTGRYFMHAVVIGDPAPKSSTYRNVLVEDCTVAENGGAGIGFMWVHDLTLRRFRSVENGGYGGVVHGTNVVVEDSDFSFNNWRGQRGRDEVHARGGLTIGGSGHLIVRSRFNHNTADGYRQDGFSRNMTYRDCDFSYNKDQETAGVTADMIDAGEVEEFGMSTGGNGVFLEIGYGPFTFENCTMVDNEGVGMKINTTHGITVKDCVIAYNDWAQINFIVTDRSGSRSGGPKYIEDFTMVDTAVVGENDELLINWRKGGKAEDYDVFIRKEFSDRGNTYWQPDLAQPFTINADYQSPTMGNFAAWQKTVRPQGSRWAQPSLDVSKRPEVQ